MVTRNCTCQYHREAFRKQQTLVMIESNDLVVGKPIWIWLLGPLRNHREKEVPEPKIAAIGAPMRATYFQNPCVRMPGLPETVPHRIVVTTGQILPQKNGAVSGLRISTRHPQAARICRQLLLAVTGFGKIGLPRKCPNLPRWPKRGLDDFEV